MYKIRPALGSEEGITNDSNIIHRSPRVIHHVLNIFTALQEAKSFAKRKLTATTIISVASHEIQI